MSTYRLKITVYNKDLDETEVRFDDILNDGGEVWKVLKMVCCKIKGVRERIKGIEDKELFAILYKVRFSKNRESV